MTKQKTFYVSWDERHSVNVKATNKEEAREKVLSGNYDEAQEQAEYTGNEEVWKV